VGNCLREDGHEVVVAGNGSEGLAALKQGRFDLVVCDIEMPVMDGLTFAREVRSDSNLRHLPVLALTTLNSPEHRQRAIDSGFDAYEVKFDRESFLTAVQALLARTAPVAVGRGDSSHE
jgi:two-component system chemotaxis sensor kinase CheA